MTGLESTQTPLVIAHLLLQGPLELRADLHVEVALGALGAQPQSKPDVIGQVDLVTRGARDELVALSVIDSEGDRRAGHIGPSQIGVSHDRTRRPPPARATA